MHSCLRALLRQLVLNTLNSSDFKKNVRLCVSLIICAICVNILTPQKAEANNKTLQACLLFPSTKSARELIYEISPSYIDSQKLLRWFRIFNPTQAFYKKIDSYNLVLIAPKKNLTRTWTYKNCKFISEISSVNLRDVVFQAQPRVSLIKKLNFSSTLKSSKALKLTPKTEIRTNKKKDLIKNKNHSNLSWRSLSLTPFIGYEFINGEGAGITNEMKMLVYGGHLQVSHRILKPLKIYIKGSITAYKKESLKNAKLSLKKNIESFLETGINLDLFKFLRLGLAYTWGEQLLYKRKVPVYMLQTYTESIELVQTNILLKLFQFANWTFGFQGKYASNLLDANTEKHLVLKYQSLLFLHKKLNNNQFGFTFGYELNQNMFDWKSTQITEINKNRYPIYFTWKTDF